MGGICGSASHKTTKNKDGTYTVTASEKAICEMAASMNPWLQEDDKIYLVRRVWLELDTKMEGMVQRSLMREKDDDIQAKLGVKKMRWVTDGKPETEEAGWLQWCAMMTPVE